MKLTKKDLIEAQLRRSQEAFRMAGYAIEANYWNSAADELYYTCFYLIRSLFTLHDIQAQTHAGVKSLFSLKFVKENQLDGKYAKLFGKLLTYRQEGRYGEYNLTEEMILPFVKEVEEFKTKVFDLLDQAGFKTNKES
jgi:uncharacterized protein (UPF0332 family)